MEFVLQRLNSIQFLIQPTLFIATTTTSTTDTQTRKHKHTRNVPGIRAMAQNSWFT